MRVLATFAGSFSFGIFLAQYVLPADWLLPCAVVAFAMAFGKLFLKEHFGRRVFLVSVGMSLAFGYNWLYIRQVQTPMESFADTERTLTMTLCEEAVSTSYGAKATVQIADFPGKVIYFGEKNLLHLNPGATVTDTVYFQSASCVRNREITAFSSKGVFLLAYQRGEPIYGDGTADSPRWWPVRVGSWMKQTIQNLFHGDAAGFLVAILTGDKSELSPEAAANLSEAGLYHILAISGMHCGFLLTLVVLTVGRHRWRLTAGLMTILLVFYALLTGGSPSVIRACVMLMLLVIAPLVRRESDGLTSLMTALFLILLKNPFAAASISLQLSFSAVAGILWLTPNLYGLLANAEKHDKGFHFIVAGFSTTMGALVFTIPLSACYFGTLVLISPISNLLCLWAASVVFILGILAVVLGAIWMPLGMIVSVIPQIFAQYILTVAGVLARIPYHAVYFCNPYLKYWLGFTYLLFAVAYLLKGKAQRKYAVTTILTSISLVVTISLGQMRYSGDLDAVVLDVGQGQSVLLRSDGVAALTDCGSGNSWYDAGEIAAHQLLTMGSRKLDYVVLTHYDYDHISGLQTLLCRVDVELLLLPKETEDVLAQAEVLRLAEKHQVAVRFVKEQQSLPFGKAELIVFPPVGKERDNESGLSVLASAGEEDLLITGDMSSATEKKLMAAYALPDLEYLVAGHHGSKYSTSEELLKALTPETVCISVGSNGYGHPAMETMRRLAKEGCVVYRTDLHGDIHLTFKQGEHYGIHKENQK